MYSYIKKVVNDVGKKSFNKKRLKSNYVIKYKLNVLD